MTDANCTYPLCKCIVSTSTSEPEPKCPRGLPAAPKDAKTERRNARVVLNALGIAADQSYLTLSSHQIESLRAEADRVGYQKAPSDKGARCRHFYDLLQSRAK